MIALVTIPIYLAWLTCFATREAANDAWSIGQGHHIDHRVEWTSRCAAALIVSSPVLWFCFSPLLVLGWLGMLAFGFSALFRYRLNKARGLSPWYMSTSNHYDGFFIRITIWWNSLFRPSSDPDLAGRIAYGVEVALFLVGIAIVVRQML